MPDNLFADLPSDSAGEAFSNLLSRPGLRIERIVSSGQCTPDDFWYDQAEGEWVIVLQGQARLRFEDSQESLPLNPGDFVNIAPHRRHRVEWTAPAQQTIWLAVHYPA